MCQVGRILTSVTLLNNSYNLSLCYHCICDHRLVTLLSKKSSSLKVDLAKSNGNIYPGSHVEFCIDKKNLHD